jgi:hypothetical protein
LKKDGPDPHAVAGLLKLYFRELPEPILTYERYESFISAQAAPDPNLRLRYLKVLCASLPPQNLSLLKYLLKFLSKVKEHSEINKMAIHNLATVFGPNLLSPPNGQLLQLVQDTPLINGIVNSLIQDYSLIFVKTFSNFNFNFFFFFFGFAHVILRFFFAGEFIQEKDIPESWGIAQYDYKGETPAELSFVVGERIKILSQGSGDGWWKVSNNSSF